jgi:hypothetical protein
MPCIFLFIQYIQIENKLHIVHVEILLRSTTQFYLGLNKARVIMDSLYRNSIRQHHVLLESHSIKIYYMIWENKNV